MCSFLVTTWLIANLTAVNEFLLPRGPDLTTLRQKGAFTFVHNLLHMTGERIAQPFEDNDVVAVYNGEIYNSRQVPDGFDGRHLYRSDGECLVPSYRHLGAQFPRALDGEWALVLVDFERNVAVLSADVFGTKPLWYSLHQGFHASSYQSALLRLGLPKESMRIVEPNQVLVLSFDLLHAQPGPGSVSASRRGSHSVHEFDVRQLKETTEDWQRAFRRAVWKRVAASNHPVFVGLSSGYDSGALHVALESEAAAHSVNYFTVAAEELPGVVASRLLAHHASVSRAWTLRLSLKDFVAERAWLEQASEPFRYGKNNWAGGSVQEDGAAAGLSAIFRRCRQAGVLVYLSGAGADEIISDYGFAGEKFFPHSSFGGLFPEGLSDLFPWRSVFLGTQRDYLMKEEVVAGSHGLEARYPFLDRRVVQEFLWLSPAAKNALYKRPVHDLLVSAGYPFDEGKKDGFAAGRNLKLQGSTSVEVVYDALGNYSAESVLSKSGPSASVAETVSGSSRWTCVFGPSHRHGPWQEARSRLAAFLATPQEEAEVVEELASALLALSAELQGVQDLHDCALGKLCLQFLLLLLYEPGVRKQQLVATGDKSLASLLAIPWEDVLKSGWPLFALLRRLSLELSPTNAGSAALELGAWLPLSGCHGRTTGEEELDAPVALLLSAAAMSSNGEAPSSVIAAVQSKLANFWQRREDGGLAGWLQSARMCEAFAALEQLSEPHYRVNLADAWHLAIQ